MDLKRVVREPNCLFAENIKPDRIRHVVNVTIETARDFDDCSNLYVHYLVDAPTEIGSGKPSRTDTAPVFLALTSPFSIIRLRIS